MSEIDEIMRHTGQFAAKLPQLITHLTQTTKWLDRRRAKKSITRLVRQELKAQEQARRDELKQIAGRIHGYRAHAQTIGARAGDPNQGADRRERDHAALVRHYTDLETDILRSGSLTTVEQGIALDGIAAATTYPQFRLGDLFGRAHRVKGVDALRYRAQVARAQAAAGIARTPAYQRPAPTTPMRVPAQEQALHYSPGQVEATQEIRRQQAANRQEMAAGRPRLYGPEQAQAVAQWAASEGVSPEQIAWEFNNAEANTRFVTKISSRHGDDPEQTQMTGWHPSESEGADWAARKISRSYWGPGLGVSATISDRDSGRPLYRVQGGPGFVDDELTEWSQKALRWREQGQQEHRPLGWPAPARGESLDAPRQRPAAQAPPEPEPPEPERERLDEVAAERDRLRERVVLLGRGIDAVTADRDDHKRKLDAVQGQLDAAKNANLRQARELEDLRANSLRLVEMQVERDRFKSERDEAVRKLAAATPARERFGSRERIAADQQLGNTAAMPREPFTAPTDPVTNGNGNRHQRPGHDPIHRSR